MKTKFIHCICTIIVFLLCSYITTARPTQTWNAEFNDKQIVIYKKEKQFDFSIFLTSNYPPKLQISIPHKEIKTAIYQPYITLQINNYFYRLPKKTNRNNLSEIVYEQTYKPIEFDRLIYDFTSQKQAYLLLSDQKIFIPLDGTSIIINRITNYVKINKIKNIPPFSNNISYTPKTSFSIKNEVILYSLLFFILILFINKKTRQMIFKILSKIVFYYRKRKALQLALRELHAHQQILSIKKYQLCYKDDYGSIIKDKWHKEIQHFIKNKIQPILSQHHLLTFLPVIKKKLMKEINKLTKNNYYKQKKLSFTSSLKPLEYEKYCAYLLQQIGWEAKVTTASGDQGADVIATKNGKKLVLQCKLYKKPVGNKAVQEVIAAQKFYYADYAAVVSNASYTISARQLASSVNIALLHHDLLQDYANNCC